MTSLTLEQQEFIQFYEDCDDWNRVVEDFSWSYNEAHPLTDLGSKVDWVAWINQERALLQCELGYDRCQQIADWWLNHSEEEPLIIAEIPLELQETYGCRFITWDGAHRAGLAFLAGWSTAPMFVGTLKH